MTTTKMTHMRNVTDLDAGEERHFKNNLLK